MRIAAGVEYCGTEFDGWQTQKKGRTVQQCVEAAFSKVANHIVTIQCAGRTDSGVHAIDQVVHFDTYSFREEHSWIFGVNSVLPNDININWVKLVDEEFHARFSALSRQYRYIILNRTTRSSLLGNHTAWHVYKLDEELMSKAAMFLVGEHDFNSFRATSCQSKTSVRNIKSLTVKRYGDFLLIDIVANAFLHHMVRNIAGVLIQIGNQKRPVDWAKEVLDAKDRTQAGFTAPASGLYLMKVSYPDRYDFPSMNSIFPGDFLPVD